MELFGFEISRKLSDKNITKEKASDKKSLKTFAPPMDTEGAAVFNSGNTSGCFGHYLDLDNLNIGNERDLILKYRQAASQPECDLAINDIINGAIVADSTDAPVNLDLDKSNQPDSVKKKIQEEFDNVIKLLKFNFEGHDIFRRWYIDGKIYYHLMIDSENLTKGIQEVRLIDPINITT